MRERTWTLGAVRRLLPPLALLVLLAAAPAGADVGDSGPSGNPQYDRAARLIAKGRYGEAEPLLRQVIAADAAHADAHNLLGYAARKLGRLEEALTHYNEALRLRPGHRGAHEYIGETYLALGQPDRAKEHLAFLDKDCWLPCEEYTDLQAAIARFEAGRR